MLTQREYDIRQLEAELKMQKLFDDWRKAFLAERAEQIAQQMAPQQQMPQQPMPQQTPPEEGELEDYGDIR